MRVCYFGTYRADYSRNRILIEGLRRCGISVVECHEPFWLGVQDRVRTASGGWLRPQFLVRALGVYLRLLKKYRSSGDYDVMVLGYPGQIDAFLARALTRIRRRPLVLDAFMSIYLIAWERGLTTSHPTSGRLIFWLEKVACRLPDLLIKDTAPYAEWFQRTFSLEPDRFRLVATGADDRTFHPIAVSEPKGEPFRVVYYGTFIPNHGVRTIIEAAYLLRHDDGIRFELIGEGPTKADALAVTREYGLANVTFSSWVERQDLPARVSRASLCLGAFGSTPQSLMTVHNKVFEAMALRKCVVTGDSQAVRDLFEHRKHVWLCKRDDAQSLAEAIVTLMHDHGLRQEIADNGFRLYKQQFTTEALGEQLKGHLAELLGSFSR